MIDADLRQDLGAFSVATLKRIQAIERRQGDQAVVIARLEAENAQLRERVAELEERVADSEVSGATLW